MHKLITRPKVSVIIPVYNVQNYINDSILSILNQTLTDLEIIVIDDGSTDKSLSILNNIASIDNRIKVLSTPNNGQSVARNIGLYHAQGEYVYFFDSDDLLEYTALEKCYYKCEKHGLDFCFFDADVFTEDDFDISRFSYSRTHLYEDRVYNGYEMLKLQFNRGYSCSPCLNLIKRSYLVNKNLFFYPRIIHEDELFTFLLYANASKLSFIKGTYFHRRLRLNSTMTSKFSDKNVEGCLVVCRELLFYARSHSISKDIKILCYKRIDEILNSVIFSINNYFTQKDVIFYRNIIKSEFRNCVSAKLRFLLKYPRFYNFFRFVKKLYNKI